MKNTFDIIVVGFGMAGVCAAIEAADAGAKVLVLDRGYGGGASALSGGVVYVGGGTRYQKEAGLHDTPENMFNYLLQETRGVVSEETLKRFCEVSASTIDWLEENGAQFSGTLCPYKTSYPTDDHYLYYSGNEKAWPYNLHAEPAARGHRQVAEGMDSGKVLLESLCNTAVNKGVDFKPLSRVEELIIEDGVIAGVKYRTVDEEDVNKQHEVLSKIGGKLGNWLPSIGNKINNRAEKSWQKKAKATEARAKAVILSAGGFVFNPEMKAKYEGGFKDIQPLGTIGDDGSGINLGASAGGYTENMHRMTAWRFMSPPSAFIEGISVGPTGTRIINEDLYGATHSDVMIHKHNGQGYLIMDSNIWEKAKSQVNKQTMPFQRAQIMYLITKGHKKANTLEELAKKIGVPFITLNETLQAYNEGIKSGAGDPAHKALELCMPIEKSPFYVIDISIKNSFAYPAPGLTLGGLRVNEETGEVLTPTNDSIKGLYAAGRTAVGICSNSYISGLSLADGVFSGRRAGVHAAKSVLVSL